MPRFGGFRKKPRLVSAGLAVRESMSQISRRGCVPRGGEVGDVDQDRSPCREPTKDAYTQSSLYVMERGGSNILWVREKGETNRNHPLIGHCKAWVKKGGGALV